MTPLTNADYRRVLRTDFVAFLHKAFLELNPATSLILADYIELMASKLEDCRAGRVKRLIVTLPPRYLKSHTVSIAFVAWLLGHQPSAQIICASYGQDLADNLASGTKKVMTSAWYQSVFATRLAPDKKAVSDFFTTKRGFRKATSVGGVLTGLGGDFLILDDPLKADDALSETRRNAVNHWFDATLLSRLNDKKNGRIIIVMQRLHQDDLVGHVISKEPWEVLSFPAIAEMDETKTFVSVVGTGCYRRKEGEPLHAVRESLEMLQATRERIGNYAFTSQYQQNPMLEGGSIVKVNWLMNYDKLPELDGTPRYMLQSWDTALKTGDSNDYSVCTTWLATGGRFYLVHVLRQRLELPDLLRAAKELAQTYQPRAVLVEDKGSGTSLIQLLRREGVSNAKPYQPTPGLDKRERLEVQTPLFEAGKVFLPLQASWLQDYRHELLTFPGAKYDDQVDSTSQALHFLSGKVGGGLDTWAKLGAGGPPRFLR